MDNKKPLIIRYSLHGAEGAGWYVWEADVEDEGYVFYSLEKPTEDQLFDIFGDFYIKTLRISCFTDNAE